MDHSPESNKKGGLQGRLFRPRQIILVDGSGPTKRMHFRPGLLTLITLILMGACTYAGWYLAMQQRPAGIVYNYGSSDTQNQASLQQATEAEAMLLLKDEEIASLEKTLKDQQREAAGLNKQVHMYESILEARKLKGVTILESRGKKQDAQLNVHLVLVKGGNYPRVIHGSIRIEALDKEGKPVLLSDEKQRTTLPFTMETHTFFDTTVTRPADIQEDSLECVVLGKRGNELTRKQIVLEDD